MVAAHSTAPRPDSLWAITSYFNPAGYARRLANYRRFRAALAVPLVTVELSFGEAFELGPGDAEILVQVGGGDVMWQKERLLNVAAGHLPPECDQVAWVDCDVVFGDAEWPARARAALGRFPLIQLFAERRDLPRDADPLDPVARRQSPRAEAVAARLARGVVGPAELGGANSPFERGSTAGLAWACRRELIDDHGLFDACIMGNGDRTMLCAACGEFGIGAGTTAMNEARLRHYLAWARPFHAAVGGRVGSIDGCVYHLWHGDLEHRRYRLRHADFAPFDFDPAADLVLGAGGAWRWGSHKPAMHAFVRDYFFSRREDGTP